MSARRALVLLVVVGLAVLVVVFLMGGPEIPMRGTPVGPAALQWLVSPGQRVGQAQLGAGVL